MVRGVELPLPCREGHWRGFYLVRWRGHWQRKGSVGVGDGRMDVNVHAIGTKPAQADWHNYNKGN